MSRRTNLLSALLRSNESSAADKEKEQRFLGATAELILTDLISIAINGLSINGPGSLVINLLNDSTVYMPVKSLEEDLSIAETNQDEDIINFVRSLLTEIDNNDWSKNLIVTLISDAGTRTFTIEAGRSQESFRALAAEFTG